MRDQEILGLYEAYNQIYEEVDTRRAPKEMIDRLNASREGHMAQDGPNKPAYDAKQRLLKKAHKKRTEVSEAKDETEEGITGLPIPKKKMSPAKRHEFEKKRREERKKRNDPRAGDSFSQHRMTGSRGHGSEYQNTRSIREEVLSYLLDEGFASDEKSAEAIMDAMSESWKQSIVEGGFNSSGRYDVGGGRTVGPVAGAVRSLFSGNLPKGQTYVPPTKQTGPNRPPAVPASKDDSGKLTDFGAGGGKKKMQSSGMTVGQVERQGRMNKGDYSG